MSRLKELAYDEMTDAQRRVHDDILAGPRDRVAGPMNAWFRSPELADLCQRLGAFCRYGTSLGQRLTELAILTVARTWTAQVEWCAHKPLALAAGVKPAVIDAIEARRPPEFARSDEAAVHALAAELQERRAVGAATYARALAELGEQKLVELVGVLGYYTSVAMVLNAFEVPIPDFEDLAAPLED